MLRALARPAGARNRVLLAVVIAMALLPRTVEAQQAGMRSRTWLGAGLGGSDSPYAGDPIAGMLELVHQRRAHYFAVRGITMLDPGGSDHVASEIGVLYGRSFTRSLGHIALAGGVAATSLYRCSSGESCSTIGFPIVLEAAFRPFSFIGFGVQAFGNINSEQRYRGAVVFVQLGWLP